MGGGELLGKVDEMGMVDVRQREGGVRLTERAGAGGAVCASSQVSGDDEPVPLPPAAVCRFAAF